MKQYVITPAAGKRLIGKAVAIHPAVKQALKSGTLVIIAGTTNGYAAEEILNSIGDTGDFDRRRFFRGITLAPSGPARGTGRIADQSGFPGDVVIVDGNTGATAELVAAGGVGGAEGSVMLAVTGSPGEEEAAGKLLEEIIKEALFVS